MILGNFTKQPSERLDYDITYTSFLGSGETLASVAVVAAPTDLELSTPLIVDNGTRVKIYIAGGTDGTKYKITVKVTTNLELIKEDEFRIKVKDV